MSGVPHYFEYRRSNGDDSQAYAFSYDEAAKQFSIGNKTVALSQFDPYTFNIYALGLDQESLAVDELERHPAILPVISGIIGGPRLHEWTGLNPNAVGQAAQIMYEAYVTLVDDPESVPKPRKGSSASFMEFAAGLREDSGIHLQVWGNCACMGPDPYALFIDGMFEDGYAGYGLHNADTQAQRASLYAGIGHLAHLAGQS